jgi:two-component system, OmpR family, phosphate regulon sensor histidine kinase PhoR
MLGSGDVAQLTRQLSETTARAEREHAKAERAEQGRRELIVNVSHELRTPTASIRGHVESLLIALEERPDGGVPPAELRNYLTIIHRETERLGDLVNELVPLARAEAGELRLDVGPVDAAGVVEEVYQSLAPLARRERSITIVREVAPGLPPVLADRGRLVQVLLNLVRNAVTYTPTGGIVSISLAPAGPEHPGRVALEVADTGIGIAPEDLERIFDRFYRTDASRARSSGGFGLGLAIVRDLVAAMGGSVTAESTVGEGSRFRVLLRTAIEEDGNRQGAKVAKGMTSDE